MTLWLYSISTMLNSMRFLSTTLFFSFFILSLPLTSFAADPYANSVKGVSNSVYRPQSVLGSPDEIYADFLDQNANLTLDFGELEEGDGYLTLYYKALDFSNRYNVIFYDADLNFLYSNGDYLDTQSTSITIPYETGIPYRYIKIENNGSSTWKLDSVETSHIFVAEEPTIEPEPIVITEPLPEPINEPVIAPSPFSQGDLIKLADDGDSETEYDSAVYAVGVDGKRHAFPNIQVFNSWYTDFSSVKIATPNEMAALPLGKNVVVRSGTFLVKLTTDPKVYAVEPEGILRWVSSEEIATGLYGSEWQKRVIDMPDTFFGNYTVGESVTSIIHPDGSFAEDPNQTGSILYVQNGIRRRVSVAEEETLRIQPRFVIQNLSVDLFHTYIDGGQLAENEAEAHPY